MNWRISLSRDLPRRLEIRNGDRAPHLPQRLWPSLARGVRKALGVWVAAAVLSGAAQAETEAKLGNVTIIAAEYAEPTSRYPHAVLGDTLEWGSLTLRYETANGITRDVEFTLPQDHVFEDLAPRLIDLNLDGRADAAMVIEADVSRGAALALYSAEGKLAETPHIGTRFRWLAPIGATDLDGDGHVELAYIDRPHLAKTLRIWRYRDSVLTEIAALPGFTNHRIGEDFISGGLRDCGTGPEMIVASANWSEVISVRHSDGWKSKKLGPFRGKTSFAAAMACR